jgi:ribosomal-protein-alanine N-acetyltransferase
MTVLVTPRLVLRRARPEDLDAFHEILSNPVAMRHWSTPPHREIGQTVDWLQSMIDSPADLSDDFVIILGSSVIGKVGCWRLPEIGYILSPSHWGHGYATEAVTAFIRHVRDRPLDHLFADVDPRNAASLSLLHRLGFQETGRAQRTYQIDDEFCDSIYLRLDGLALDRL